MISYYIWRKYKHDVAYALIATAAAYYDFWIIVALLIALTGCS